MAAIVRTTDKKARITLPRSFANVTVIMEQVGDGEVRIRKAQVVPFDEYQGPEDAIPPLSRKDQEAFLRLLTRPPRANAALKRAFARHKAR